MLLTVHQQLFNFLLGEAFQRCHFLLGVFQYSFAPTHRTMARILVDLGAVPKSHICPFCSPSLSLSHLSLVPSPPFLSPPP